MPRISAFFGIVIWMYYEDDLRHHTPHIHAEYAGDRASIAIEAGELLGGSLPPKQLKRVRRWIEARQQALLENWDRATRNEALQWIEPI